MKPAVSVMMVSLLILFIFDDQLRRSFNLSRCRLHPGPELLPVNQIVSRPDPACLGGLLLDPPAAVGTCSPVRTATFSQLVFPLPPGFPLYPAIGWHRTPSLRGRLGSPGLEHTEGMTWDCQIEGDAVVPTKIAATPTASAAEPAWTRSRGNDFASEQIEQLTAANH
jgi:hypothetical protein